MTLCGHSRFRRRLGSYEDFALSEAEALRTAVGYGRAWL